MRLFTSPVRVGEFEGRGMVRIAYGTVSLSLCLSLSIHGYLHKYTNKLRNTEAGVEGGRHTSGHVTCKGRRIRGQGNCTFSVWNGLSLSPSLSIYVSIHAYLHQYMNTLRNTEAGVEGGRHKSGHVTTCIGRRIASIAYKQSLPLSLYEYIHFF